ncbi:hypothetical protein SERLA73DRAFT_115651, partial [Serpula lacrymans var. lacrymans S7.3]
VTIDEAHWISEWGDGFRPEYGDLGRLQWILPRHISFHAASVTITQFLDLSFFILCFNLVHFTFHTWCHVALPLFVQTPLSRAALPSSYFRFNSLTQWSWPCGLGPITPSATNFINCTVHKYKHSVLVYIPQ